MKFFLLAVLTWFVVSYPSLHLWNLYFTHHVIVGSLEARPGLFDAYVRRATWLTVALSFLAPCLFWAIEKVVSPFIKFKCSETLVIGPVIGIFSSSVMYSLLNPGFRSIGNVPLEAGSIAYAGLLAGLLAGELCRRDLIFAAGIHPTRKQLGSRLWVSGIMTWAVLLKILESFYLSTVAPGNDPSSMHIFMLASVVVWTPWVCKYLWKKQAVGFRACVLWSVAPAVLLPPIFGTILLVPAVFLAFAQITISGYGMIWGAFFVKMNTPGGMMVLGLAPGLAWGLVVGTLLWRYQLLDQSQSGKSAASN